VWGIAHHRLAGLRVHAVCGMPNLQCRRLDLNTSNYARQPEGPTGGREGPATGLARGGTERRRSASAAETSLADLDGILRPSRQSG
jgi:hypothetical protein